MIVHFQSFSNTQAEKCSKTVFQYFYVFRMFDRKITQADMEVEMVANMEVDKKKSTSTFELTLKSNLVRELAKLVG